MQRTFWHLLLRAWRDLVYWITGSSVIPSPSIESASIKGIDVSRWQANIDWDLVHGAGYKFAFVKATEGSTWRDPTFKRNREAAMKAGLMVGYYHVFRPKVDASAQAKNFVTAVGTRKNGELPAVLDIELPAEWAGISQEKRIQMILRWLIEVQSSLGVRPIIYYSPSFADDVLRGDPRLSEYPLWIAHYTARQQPRVPRPWKSWLFWQYTERGRVPGIIGDVDIDLFFGTEDDLAALSSPKTKSGAPRNITHRIPCGMRTNTHVEARRHHERVRKRKDSDHETL